MIEEALCGLLGVERPKIPEETGEDDFYMTAVSEEAVSEEAVSEEAVSEEAVVLEESECTTEPPPKPASNQRTLF
jgi:hypothetical protein